MSNPADFSHYNVYRSDSFAGPYVLIASITTTNFEDTTAVEGQTYFYQLTSVDLYGNESDPTDPLSVTFSLSLINLASITGDNVAVVYRENDSESEDAALRYQEIHSLTGDQLIAIPCSAREVLDNYAEFQSEVENPIIEALTETGQPLTNRIVYAIVLMPRVPGGFLDNGDTISSTSRLSRMFFSFDTSEKNILNPLYDRKTFKRFDETDADSALIVTRIDSPLAAITNQWLENIRLAKDQLLINGKFFFDPYSAYQGDDAIQYQSDLLTFSGDLLARLGLDVTETVQVDPYIDALISSVEDDSFFWGWGADRGSLSYFKASANIRGFFYNADFDGAETIRDIDARTWPLLAIRQGYIATAGSMSDPGIDTFLRPDPFFDALFRGATIGEAFLYSQPRLNTSIAVFGDPLSRFSFSLAFDGSSLVNQEQAWQQINECFAESAINIFRKNKILTDARQLIVNLNDFDAATELSPVFHRLGSLFADPDWAADYQNLAIAMFNLAVIRNQTNYETFYPDIADYLERHNIIIPEITLDALRNEEVKALVSENNIYEEGTWEFTFELEHDPGTFAFYQFELDIATDSDFTNILLSKDSLANSNNWFFEETTNNFVPIGVNGVTSNFAGFRIRYESQPGEELERGRYYYFRIRQKDQLTILPYRTFREVVYR